jgi:hypothetical protein
MGQPVVVVQKPTGRSGLVRYEANRSFTGMGHERFTDPEAAHGPRPAAVLVRRLFETGKVDAVHVYSNVVTVEVKKGFTADGLAEVIENLYIYYTPGFVPPVLESPPGPAPEASAAAGEAAGETPAPSAAASRVPAHLLERSRAAKARAAASKEG